MFKFLIYYYITTSYSIIEPAFTVRPPVEELIILMVKAPPVLQIKTPSAVAIPLAASVPTGPTFTAARLFTKLVDTPALLVNR